ncbi:4Fe-4S dicluster domain-containing protein [bacterium]|nr:4Fe-4S dicluster domain-containing protein [bacterium]
MKKPKLRELGEAIKAVIKGPYTTKFPFVAPSIYPEFRGKPVFVEENCILCGACEQICPVDAIDVRDIINDDGTATRIMHRNYNQCIWCSMCSQLCTVGDGNIFGDKAGIKITNEFDLSTLDKETAQEQIEGELVLCEKCGKPITSKKHLLWLAERLGTKAFQNQTLFLTKMKELGLTDEEYPYTTDEILREDLNKILCPSCRRAAMMKEDWGF